MRLSSWLAPMLFLPALAFADSSVYRWTDAAGQVNFSQTPPPIGIKYDLIQGGKVASTTPSAAGGASSRGRSADETHAREQEFIKNAEAERKAKNEAKEKEKAAKAESLVKCAAARERATFLEEHTARGLITKADDGNYARVDEAEFRKQLDSAKKDVATNCHSAS